MQWIVENNARCLNKQTIKLHCERLQLIRIKQVTFFAMYMSFMPLSLWGFIIRCYFGFVHVWLLLRNTRLIAHVSTTDVFWVFFFVLSKGTGVFIVCTVGHSSIVTSALLVKEHHGNLSALPSEIAKTFYCVSLLYDF